MSIDWGDGTTPSGGSVVPPTEGSTFDVTGSHTYADEGSYSISVSLNTNQCNSQGAGMALGGGGTVTVQVTGQGGIPASGVSAVVFNLTATNTTAPSFLTDVVIDVNGWYGDGAEPAPAGNAFTAVTPTRICDTRANQAGVVTNPCNNGGAGSALLGGTSMAVRVTSSGGVVPAGATAVVANVTVSGTTAPSFLTVWPSDATQPNISDLNWAAGETVPNLVVVELSPTGQISVFNHVGSADVIIDVVGYYP